MAFHKTLGEGGKEGLAVGLFLVLVIVTIVLGRSERRDDRDSAVPPKAGVACPGILSAYEHLSSGNRRGIGTALLEAAQAAERSLDRSGEVFGRPEHLALEADFVFAKEGYDTPRLEKLLNRARDACRSMGRRQIESETPADGI